MEEVGIGEEGQVLEGRWYWRLRTVIKMEVRVLEVRDVLERSTLDI